MGFLRRLSASSPARADSRLFDDRYWTPDAWRGQLTAAGVRVSEDLAMTISAVWRAVTGIVGDTSTLPCQVFRYLDNGGKDRVRNHRLSYPLRWQPNQFQTAQQWTGMIVGHQLLRGNAYVELVPGPRGFADQMIPRHPDRVRKERLPNGRPSYRLLGGGAEGQDRVLTADEMMHLPDLLTFDGWLGASRIAYGLQSFGGILAAERAAQSFFARGMTASVVATHKGGELDETEIKNIHQSLSLYAAGSQNNGGILIIEDDMSIAHLGIEPEKAQLLATRQNGVRQVANWFGYPGHKLEIDNVAQAYAAREQANLEYVVGCVRPIVINLEQAFQMNLLLDSEKEQFFIEFLMDALFRGDLKSQAEYYSKAIQFGWMNRNEVRLRSNLNPADGLDRFLEPTNMKAPDDPDPNASQPAQPQDEAAKVQRFVGRDVRASLLAYEAGLRIVRKEKAAVLKAAEKHAKDGAAWSNWLREFYADHAAFVSATLKVPLKDAREYAAEHGTVLENNGISVMEDWEHTVATELAAWALEGQRAA